MSLPHNRPFRQRLKDLGAQNGATLESLELKPDLTDLRLIAILASLSQKPELEKSVNAMIKKRVSERTKYEITGRPVDRVTRETEDRK